MSVESYYVNTQMPWSKMFYAAIWSQLPEAHGLNILDFGSGFGITADHLAERGHVTAVEPNAEMIAKRTHAHAFRQIHGGLDALSALDGQSFDLIVCHNVLEYIPDKDTVVAALARLLAPGGVLSLVKHNHAGRIMQRVIFENSLDQAMDELAGTPVEASTFGEVRYYEMSDIHHWADEHALEVDRYFGIRTFFGLIQNNDIKNDPTWQEKMLALERRVADIPAYRDIAFFHHVMLKKP